MKKITSIIMATAMAVVMCTATSVSALAANVQSPTAPTAPTTEPTTKKNIIPPSINVNGQNISGITYRASETNPNEITFIYEGEGRFIRWEENLKDLGLVAGTDYTLVLNADNSMVITFISVAGIGAWENGRVIVNAIVEFDDVNEPSTTEIPEDTSTTEATKKETTTAKKNSSSKSPATGVSTGVAAGIAAVGAGIAVLAAAKKKDAE